MFYVSLKVFCFILKFLRKNIASLTYSQLHPINFLDGLQLAGSLQDVFLPHSQCPVPVCFDAFISGVFPLTVVPAVVFVVVVTVVATTPLATFIFIMSFVFNIYRLHLPGTTQSCPGGKIKLQFL